MPKLTTKVQYKGFLPGQFAEEAKRSLEETIRLIESFPWSSEREKIDIDRTGPSITIENGSGEFLKLAPRTNEQFVLYFLNKEQKLYTKSFAVLEEACLDIRSFFDAVAFNPDGFQIEHAYPGNVTQHFINRECQFVVTRSRAWRYFLKTVVLPLLLSLFFVGQMVFNYHSNPLWFYAIFSILFFFFGGLQLLLFSNYYFYSKSKILIVPFNRDVFYFGTANNLNVYYKTDVNQITRYLVYGRNQLAFNFELDKVEFNDGRTIFLPDIFGGKYGFPGPECIKINRKYWPALIWHS